MLADLDALARHWSELDARAWAGMSAPIDDEPRRPCLSCAQREVVATVVSVPFADGETTIGTDTAAHEALQQARMVIMRDNEPDVRVIVRGHADPGETDGQRVARERAESVAARLIAAGVPAANIEVRSHGSELPVSRESEANRRVDFQVLPSSGG